MTVEAHIQILAVTTHEVSLQSMVSCSGESKEDDDILDSIVISDVSNLPNLVEGRPISVDDDNIRIIQMHVESFGDKLMIQLKKVK